MQNSLESELAAVKKAMIKTQIIGAPGMILIGLGMYGVFAAQGDAFIPLLNSESNCYILLAVGACIAVWEAVTVIKLARKQNALTQEIGRQS